MTAKSNTKAEAEVGTIRNIRRIHAHVFDGGLLRKVESGNHEAIEEMSRLAAELLSEVASKCFIGEDARISWLTAALQAMSKGESPDDAFKWSRTAANRPAVDNSTRDWFIREAVQDYMRSTGKLLTLACEAVSVETGGSIALGSSSIKAICKGLKVDSERIPMPEDMFTLPRLLFPRKNI